MEYKYAQWYNKNYLNDTTELITYSCEEEVKTFTASITGNYVLEAWGAQGGNISSASDDSGHTIEAIDGGKGGYSYGVVHLNAGDEIYVAVGCEGKELKNAAKGTLIDGGYNGGGRASSENTKNIQSSGGGATHFAINNNLGVLENYVNNQNDVLVVAGGGGGSYSGIAICYYSYGGYGGGLIAGFAQSFYKTNCRSSALVLGEDIYYQGMIIPGADQTSHTNDMYYYGSFGQGANAKYSETGDDAGAGGGWSGGNKLGNNENGYNGAMAGSGGSGHVNLTTLIEGNSIAGNMNIPTHNGSSYMTGNTGDGYARISLVNPKYKVKFNSNGGTGSMSDMDFVYGTSRNLTANTFTRRSYSFAGWNTEANGSGTSYSDEQLVNNLTSVDGAEVVLYAQWTLTEGIIVDGKIGPNNNVIEYIDDDIFSSDEHTTIYTRVLDGYLYVYATTDLVHPSRFEEATLYAASIEDSVSRRNVDGFSVEYKNSLNAYDSVLGEFNTNINNSDRAQGSGVEFKIPLTAFENMIDTDDIDKLIIVFPKPTLIYAYKPDNWSEIHAYLFQGELGHAQNILMQWPGPLMQHVENNLYVYEVPSTIDYYQIVFNGGYDIVQYPTESQNFIMIEKGQSKIWDGYYDSSDRLVLHEIGAKGWTDYNSVSDVPNKVKFRFWAPGGHAYVYVLGDECENLTQWPGLELTTNIGNDIYEGVLDLGNNNCPNLRAIFKLNGQWEAPISPYFHPGITLGFYQSNSIASFHGRSYWVESFEN